MKKILCSLLFFTTFFSVYAQQNVQGVLTSGKWFLDSVQESGERPEKAENKTDEWLVFHNDGKLERSEFEELSTLQWKYLGKEKAIKISDTETVYHRVIEVSNDKLVVEVTDDLNQTSQLIVTYIK